MTEHEAQEGVNRRHLFQAAAAGAAVSGGVIGSPALARSSLPRRQPLPQPRIMHLTLRAGAAPRSPVCSQDSTISICEPVGP